ncbi:nonribosomal peptide synthetase MxaA [Paracoccus shanxieyensis]|uniref:Nonribosomal peptide synthetase MxaA n=1 Tax=Paracoccus shanxieyensis TaxID=2675752 RepID=A0A6L6IYA3_9RHOB|nr:nonribosomal peptide synthetase MxaA [Paracoccus shanxieyensis]MTH64050.1 nonribosomal peptide synthetase MxaA [Paracoccus shanxieyensis]MTH86909.1 nonribosomal peptide synthetase MxaA [Paracoccus shanxieyensis]
MKWLALILLPLPAMAQQVQNPRPYGWWLGDELVQTIRVPGAVDPASLPRPRAVDYWLDLRDISRRDVPGGTEITLRWQNFYSALEPREQQVPPSRIRLSDGTALDLPGFRFVTSPIRPILAPSTVDQLQPDPPFHLIDPTPARLRLAAAVLALIAGALALAWHQAWFPFRRRPARPFARAARQIARLPDAQARPLLHHALDQSFGRVLIGAELDRFLTAAPHFAPLGAQLRGFFAASDAAYFGAGAQAPQDIPRLARDLAAIERGRR